MLTLKRRWRPVFNGGGRKRQAAAPIDPYMMIKDPNSATLSPGLQAHSAFEAGTPLGAGLGAGPAAGTAPTATGAVGGTAAYRPAYAPSRIDDGIEDDEDFAGGSTMGGTMGTAAPPPVAGTSRPPRGGGAVAGTGRKTAAPKSTPASK